MLIGSFSVLLEGHRLWGGPAMHDDSFITHDSNFSKSAGLTLSFHVCPSFCSFNGTIIENASRLLFIFKALVRSIVQVLTGPAVLARLYLLLHPVLSPKQTKLGVIPDHLTRKTSSRIRSCTGKCPAMERIYFTWGGGPEQTLLGTIWPYRLYNGTTYRENTACVLCEPLQPAVVTIQQQLIATSAV